MNLDSFRFGPPASWFPSAGMTPQKRDRPRPQASWEALDGHMAQHDRMVAGHEMVPVSVTAPQTPQKKHRGDVELGPG